MRSSSALATFSHSELIAVPTLRTSPALAFEIDALGEVAGDRRLDDAADRRLELVRHLLHRRFALGMRRAPRPLLLRLHFLDAQKIFLECLGRSRVFADLVATRCVWNFDRLVAACEFVEDRSDLANWLRDGSPDPKVQDRDHDANQQHAKKHGQLAVGVRFPAFAFHACIHFIDQLDRGDSHGSIAA